MRREGNTIFITGGSSGLGFELAKRFAKSNQVIICGRSADKLAKAKRKVPLLHTIQADISQLEECRRVYEWIAREFPGCNALINNAAFANNTIFAEDPDMISKTNLEIQTNLMAPIWMSRLFLPLLQANNHPEIVNVTTGLVYAPRKTYPIYNATKSGLHAFTQTLRMQLQDSPIKVREILYPVVDTPWHKGAVPKMAISSERAVDEAIAGLLMDKSEIKVGKVKLLSGISRLSPALAIKLINRVE